MSPLLRGLVSSVLTLAIAGCSTVDNGGSGSFSQGSAAELPIKTVGRVLLDSPVAGAHVVAKGPSGESVGETDTDANGLFFLNAPLLPGGRVSASLPSANKISDATLQLEAVIDSSNGRLVVLNYPVHLVGVLQAHKPTLTRPQAVAEVKRLLQISDSWDLASLEESEVSPFSHTVFLQEAFKAGGVAPLTQDLLRTSDAGGTRRFKLAAGLAGDVGGDALTSIIGNIGAGAASFVGGQAAGWVVRLISQAVAPPADPFAGIDGQFLDLKNQLTYLADQFTQQQVFLDLQNQVTNPISQATSNLSTQARSFSSPVPPLSLYSLGDNNALLQALQITNYELALTTLFQVLTGADDLVTSYPGSPAVDLRPERTYARVTYPTLGIDSDLFDPYRGYGAFSFRTLSSLQTIHDYYLNYATLAANLLAETAHATVDGVDPGGANLARSIRAAQLQMLGTSDGTPGLAARRKQVQQLAPPPLTTTGSVFIDRQYGLMWCTSSVGGLTYQQTTAMASSLQIGRYSGWRLPYAFEYDQLYSRLDAGWSNRTAAQRSGLTKTLLLKDLGFQLYQLSSSHQFWCVDFDGFYQTFGSFTYGLDGGGASIFPASGQHDALFVRSYVESTDSSFFDDTELSPEPNAALRVESSSSPGGVTQLKASMNFQCPIGGQFTITGRTIEPIYGDYITQNLGVGRFPISGIAKGSQRPNKDITNRVVWRSSDDSMALVSNLEGEEGKVLWRTPAPNGNQTCTFTGSFQGTTGSITLTRPSDLQWQVDSILLTPNQSSVSFAQNSTQEVLFVATVFLKNPATGDRTAFRSSAVGGESSAPPLTWSLEKVDGTPLPFGFSNPAVSDLVLHSSDTTESVVIVKATSGGVTASTKLYLLGR